MNPRFALAGAVVLVAVFCLWAAGAGATRNPTHPPPVSRP